MQTTPHWWAMLMREEQRMDTLAERVHWMLFESDFELTEVVLAIPLLGWAIVLGIPGTSFSAFVALHFLAPYEPWIALLCAVLFTLKVWTGYTRRRLAHALVMFLISVWWTYVAVSICVVTPLSTGTPCYLAFAVGQAWVFLRFVARYDLFDLPDGM